MRALRSVWVAARRSRQQQQHAADHMPMIATWRAYDHCEQLEGLPHDAMPAPDHDQPIPAAGRGPAASSGVCPRSRRTNPARCRGALSEAGDAAQRADQVVALRDGDPKAHDSVTLVLLGQSDERLPLAWRAERAARAQPPAAALLRCCSLPMTQASCQLWPSAREHSTVAAGLNSR